MEHLPLSAQETHFALQGKRTNVLYYLLPGNCHRTDNTKLIGADTGEPCAMHSNENEWLKDESWEVRGPPTIGDEQLQSLQDERS